MRSTRPNKRLLALGLAAAIAIGLVAASVSAAQPPVQNTTLSAHGPTYRVQRRTVARHTSRKARRSARVQSGHLLFSGSRISDFAFNQSAPGAVSEVPDPAGGGEQVLKMTVGESDVAPVTPTDNPRAQLVTPAFIDPGEESWWHTRFYLPAAFPSDVPGWVTVLEGPYGPPWDGSPPVSISVDDGEIRFQRDDTYQYDIPWQQPIERGRWIDVLFHTRFGHEGLVELWIDGQQVTFFEDSPHNPLHEAPSQRLDMQTMDHTNDGGPNFFVIQNYRKAHMFNSLTVYHGATEVGTSRESVEAG